MSVEVNVERKGVEVKWDAGGDDAPKNVKLFARRADEEGDDAEWHNTASITNDGKGALSYPADYVGESYIEVRDSDGNVIDSGYIEVGSGTPSGSGGTGVSHVSTPDMSGDPRFSG